MKYYGSAATNKPANVAAKNKKDRIQKYSRKCKADKQKRKACSRTCVLAFSTVSNLFLIWSDVTSYSRPRSIVFNIF